jgi:hypothetical protein
MKIYCTVRTHHKQNKQATNKNNLNNGQATAPSPTATNPTTQFLKELLPILVLSILANSFKQYSTIQYNTIQYNTIQYNTKMSFTNIGDFTSTRANSVFESHKKYLEWRKSEWSSRGEAALAKRVAARASTHKTWRQMKGMQLIAHEMNHPGNKPFVIGMG